MPNEEHIWEAIQETKSDVKEIKEALLGDGYGNSGYKSRIELLEKNSRYMKSKISFFDTGMKVIGGLITIVGTIFAIAKYIPELIPFILK